MLQGCNDASLAGALRSMPGLQAFLNESLPSAGTSAPSYNPPPNVTPSACSNVAAGESPLGALAVGLGLGLVLGFGFGAASCDAAQVSETLEHEHHHPHLHKAADQGGEERAEGDQPTRPEPPGESPVAKPQSQWGFSLMGQSVRRRIFFYYEKRIRTRSPPEKVFEYFASIKDQGETLMTPADLMRAVVPVFPPSDSPYARTGSLSGEPSQGGLRCPESKLFKLFDTNGDGFISFPEYIFFVTLLSIPPWEVEQAFHTFDLDQSGMVDKDEFKSVMAVLRKQSKAGQRNRGGLRFLSGKSPPRLGTSVDEGGVVEYFFGKDGKQCLTLEAFQKFMAELQEEITRLEFAHYDWRNEGTVSAKDFALSMVAAADMEHLAPLMARVDKLAAEEAFKSVRISYEDFWAFAHCRWVVPRLDDALDQFLAHSPEGVDGLTRGEFREAVHDVCGVSFDDITLDIIFYIFDIDGDGRISCEEFLTAADSKDGKNASWGPVMWAHALKGMW
ncbi:hypothetical protein KFL_000540150 [Klebsormidium nitens]|uniref:EF-hand domain-containing protein n=1 Tax=Klebsormidium nitens TaxID=105231 RepID=A0A0U9HJ85_KLENI|nr:hypothetical protein KFL_000540150 [Klebsormidium nitens]|eukprot:GAQ80438.1 hypothetical protein KFL_000540150 [Klebsormidium nitens]